MSRSVLYDAPGPRGRRRIAVASVVAGVVLVGLAVLAVRRLAANGQFDGSRWSPLFNPGDEDFADLWRLLGGGLVHTLTAAALAMSLSLLLGVLIATTRISAARWYRWAVVGMVELLRGVPVVIAIFFAAQVLPVHGLKLPPLWYIVIGLTAYNSVVISEIVRAGILAVPKGQRDAAAALGLTRGQTLRIVLLPQAFRSMLPALISQLVVILKDTSLGAFISYEELLRRALIAIQTLHNPIQTYLVIGGIFILINYLVTRLATYLEARLSGRRARPSVPAEDLATG
ncbi:MULTISPECIES: amino acid ABC transporter permease [Protofrankia]|uniref:Polar amino acid ABC transporter permease n=1 Tax=Protofrankia coriariae TaxID=1562887 RepID=A0ABR5F661_9ACTN|nr:MULTISPECIES: amino acid ABC transporter permease [Protofrankia]KLL12219.1 polar amino acid ABC transporter permease [Protofrankia coriariae]ONH37860.1 polar amino acid ABC transporter permease [Protofrankia sp. BMG5.30]